MYHISLTFNKTMLGNVRGIFLYGYLKKIKPYADFVEIPETL